MFTPDLVQDTCVLLNVALVGSMQSDEGKAYGLQGIPRVVIPANTPVSQMNIAEVHSFHRSADGQPQFTYYGHLLRSGGTFAGQLTQQVLSELIATELFSGGGAASLTATAPGAAVEKYDGRNAVIQY